MDLSPTTLPLASEQDTRDRDLAKAYAQQWPLLTTAFVLDLIKRGVLR